MKSHEPKKGTKQERKIRGKQRVIKNQIKRRKDNKMLSQKSEKGARKKT
jgi:hypothetical protein